MYKNWSIKAIKTVTFFLLFVIITNFITDPYQHYRKTTIYPAFFGGDQKYLNPGLAKNYIYDAVIIGTSMTENFYVPNANKELNAKFLKLSISGSTAYEQKLILNQAIKTKQVKKVLWGLDIYSLNGKVEQYRNGKKNFPLYLYDDNIFNDYKYLLNKDTLFEFFKILKKYYIKKDKFRFDINNSFMSENHQENISKDDIVNIFNQKLVNKNFNRKNFLYTTMKINFDENVYKTVLKNQNIEFFIFLPPYSILAWYDIDEQGWLTDALKLRVYMHHKLSKLKNVHLYDLQADINFITNLNNYADTTHYKPIYNNFYILRKIKNKKISPNVYENNDKIRKCVFKLKNGYLNNFLKKGSF